MWGEDYYANGEGERKVDYQTLGLSTGGKKED